MKSLAGEGKSPLGKLLTLVSAVTMAAASESVAATALAPAPMAARCAYRPVLTRYGRDALPVLVLHVTWYLSYRRA